jgi:hypothetical protein
MFVLFLFLIIVLWILGYSPLAFNGSKIIDLGFIAFTQRNILIVLVTLFLAISIKKPFRNIALGLYIIWLLPYIGIPLSAGLPGGGALVGGALISQSLNKTKTKVHPKSEILISE